MGVVPDSVTRMFEEKHHGQQEEIRQDPIPQETG
jgi:hypothetical protein